MKSRTLSRSHDDPTFSWAHLSGSGGHEFGLSLAFRDSGQRSSTAEVKQGLDTPSLLSHSKILSKFASELCAKATQEHQPEFTLLKPLLALVNRDPIRRVYIPKGLPNPIPQHKSVSETDV